MTDAIISIAGMFVAAFHVHGILHWRGRMYLNARHIGLEAEIDTRE